MHQLAQISQTQVSQQEEQIKLLQSKLISVENQVIDITIFQSQAMEIRKKVEVAQQDLLAKVETIQNHFHTIEQALKDISLREREVATSSGCFPRSCYSNNERRGGHQFQVVYPREN
jgi:uncharacterized protein YoxC